MSRQNCTSISLVLATLAVLAGCRPSQPFYLAGRQGDLSHYLDTATQLEYPDTEAPPLPDAEQTINPLMLSNPEPREMWDLTLEDAISTAINNSKVIRRLFHVGGTASSQGVGAFVGSNINSLVSPNFDPFQSGDTIYDPALIESNPNVGVEAALSAFDAQLRGSLFYDKTDRPQNVTPVSPFIPSVSRTDAAAYVAEISKKTASGGTYFLRNNINYDNGNSFGAFRALPSVYTTVIEAEWRQPLMQGRGTAVNRAPIVLARIRTDVDLAQLEANVRNLLKDTEDAYWTLMFQYRRLEANKMGRDSSLRSWRQVYELYNGGRATAQEEAQSREQYYGFRFEVEQSLRDLYNAETNLRFMMGLAPTDGRLIRPVTEPTTAPFQYDWNELNAEALVRMPELRQQKWVIKARETELIVAKNQLLPQFNATAIYRWVGLGDELMGANRAGINFPNPGSRAFDELSEGKFQESRFGVDFLMPVGFRKALAGVRSSQLLIARERARLEDAELQVSHLLTTAVRNSDGWYQIMQTQFNRLVAAKTEERIRRTIWDEGANDEQGRHPLNLLLDSQRRVASAQQLYYNALIEYNRSIAEIHFRKGSLLEYDGVQMAEGPWPQKAYYDALGRARQRAASAYMNYGWTRPRVVSQGPINQESDGEIISGEESYEGSLESVPPGRRTPPAVPPGNNDVLTPTADPAVKNVAPDRKMPVREDALAKSDASSVAFDVWEEAGVNRPKSSEPATAVIRNVSHEEPARPAFKPQKTVRPAPPANGWRKPEPR